MNDADGGSSGAAQSAREPDPESSGQRGFLSRIFGALNPNETVDKPENGSDKPGNGPRVSHSGLGMLNLRRMRLEDVAIPTADIISVPVDIRKDDLVKKFRDSGLTRLPVYDGTLDTPVGLVHLKDFALKHGFNGKGSRYSLRKMVRPLLFAPPSMPIGVLLQKMQSERIHMALVIDEYGGVDGLLTLEDLVEQVIGEIEDEHDTADSDFWVREKPGCYLAQAKAPLEEFESEIGMQLIDPHEYEDIDTLGGLVFMLTGRVPVRGECIRHPDGPEFEIVDADPRRLKRIRVHIPKAQLNG